MKQENNYEDDLYETLAGQIVASEGILLGKSEFEMRDCLAELKCSFGEDQLTTVQGLAKKVVELYGAEDKEDILASMLYLLYDERGIYSPQVTFLCASPFVTIAMPVRPNGSCNGVVRAFNEGEEYARAEKVWCDDEVEYDIQEESK